jgi:hypothetical protein
VGNQRRCGKLEQIIALFHEKSGKETGKRKGRKEGEGEKGLNEEEENDRYYEEKKGRGG